MMTYKKKYTNNNDINRCSDIKFQIYPSDNEIELSRLNLF